MILERKMTQHYPFHCIGLFFGVEPKIPYYVTIKTKNYNGFSADTMSDVHIVFFGDKGNSGRWSHLLKELNLKGWGIL